MSQGRLDDSSKAELKSPDSCVDLPPSARPPHLSTPGPGKGKKTVPKLALCVMTPEFC